MCRVLEHAGCSGDFASVKAQLATEIARVEADTFRLVRGHDFVDLLRKLLRSSWGRPIGGFYRASRRQRRDAPAPYVRDRERMAYPLFQELRNRFAPANNVPPEGRE